MSPTGDIPCVCSAQSDKQSEGLSSFKKLWTVTFNPTQTCLTCKNLGHLCSNERNSHLQMKLLATSSGSLEVNLGAILQGGQLAPVHLSPPGEPGSTGWCWQQLRVPWSFMLLDSHGQWCWKWPLENSMERLWEPRRN